MLNTCLAVAAVQSGLVGGLLSVEELASLSLKVDSCLYDCWTWALNCFSGEQRVV